MEISNSSTTNCGYVQTDYNTTAGLATGTTTTVWPAYTPGYTGYWVNYNYDPKMAALEAKVETLEKMVIALLGKTRRRP